MSTLLIAQRYAKALFDLSVEMNVVEEVKSDMDLILSVCSSNKDFSLMLKSPVIRHEKKIIVIEKVFKNEISELSLRYLSIITRKNREKFISNIALELISIYKKFKNIFILYLESAEAVSDNIRKKVIALLEDKTKGTIELHEEVNKELVGGFVLTYDDYKYDASIAFQLRKMKKSIAEFNLYISEL